MYYHRQNSAWAFPFLSGAEFWLRRKDMREWAGAEPRAGVRRLRRGSRACSPMGRSIASVGDPKVSKGERREAGIQWIQPPKAVSDPEFRQTTSGAHGSANRADCLPRVFFAECGPKGVQGGERKAPLLATIGNNFAVSNSPWWGLTRRLRRERMGLPPRRGVSTFFRRERKYQRKHAARRLREKALYCPF